MSTPPRLRRHRTPTQAELDAARREAEEYRAQLEARRAAERPARLAALAAGPQLNDLEAAADCRCSCHPRPADAELHDGGVRCPCQRSAEERRATLDEFFARTDKWFESDVMVEARRLRDERVAAAVAELDVEVDEIGGLAPFVITGRVDGRGFYLRERHDAYQIVVAPDDDPSSDPWSAKPHIDAIEVRTGDASELDGPDGFDEAAALTFAVNEIRLFLLRRSCEHVAAVRFCPHCGVEMAHAARWRRLS